jgi:hypothetical protein
VTPTIAPVSSAYRDDPETKKYDLWMHGIPMFYAGPTKTDLQISWDRRPAHTRKPGWRAYLLKKAELAVDAGVDAIMWGNTIGYNNGMAQLLEDTQRMADRRARKSGWPKVMVYANIHVRPDRFGMNDINQVIWEARTLRVCGTVIGRWTTHARSNLSTQLLGGKDFEQWIRRRVHVAVMSRHARSAPACRMASLHKRRHPH